ncbi:hypothetical protein [Nannocystis sp.]|uniref:hypothetical protein n=1 Tax=Nannocystis sp. TaxID=1962667 RepID=UPI0024260F3E|nr:hypothetical protein [Nannocystis sp.]MBK7829336.1 hypothetical protein [Nannocystis sp.]MBK9752733.1 hypothetical protein [Nannocystis sp.]
MQASADPKAPQDEESAGGWRGAVRRMEAFGWARVLAFLAWVVLVVATYASLDPVIGKGSLSLLGLVTLKTVPLLLAVLVALPNVTLFIIARMILFRFSRRSFSLQFRGEEDEGRPLPAAALRQAEWLWNYERSRAQTRYEAGLLPQVAVFGLLSSATLSFCVLGIHLPPEQLFPNIANTPTWHIWVAWTVLATATTSFLLTMGRILVRIAGDDATTRTFANAARSYGLCVVSGGLLACLTVSTTEAPETAQMSIAMGIAVGLLGDRAFLAVSNRAAAMLGAEPEVVDPGNELRSIEGLGADDQQRLQEESISSVHGLAFVPVPRLFFNSSLNLQRICDWQDQALLQVYIGASRARALREFFQIRGAVDAQRLAGLQATMSAELWQQLVACMSFPSEAHLRQLFTRLTSDGRIDELRAYRGATLRMDTVIPGVRRV